MWKLPVELHMAVTGKNGARDRAVIAAVVALPVVLVGAAEAVIDQFGWTNMGPRLGRIIE